MRSRAVTTFGPVRRSSSSVRVVPGAVPRTVAMGASADMRGATARGPPTGAASPRTASTARTPMTPAARIAAGRRRRSGMVMPPGGSGRIGFAPRGDSLPPMDLELAGRVALVTGATRGIGRAIAAKLAAEGCAVAICARDDDAVAQTVAALEAQGAKAFGASVDVTDDAALEGFVDAAAQTLGGLDLVVANAGGSAGGDLLADTTGDDWRRTMWLNVVHAAVRIRAALPRLRARGGGAALVIASISGSRPQPKAQYAAAKAAEIHLAVSLGRELGPDRIRVNALSPGSILFEGGSWDRRRN